MRCHIQLNQSHLLGNYATFRSICKDSQVAPVLKANAYGHGFQEIYEALKPANPDWLCTNEVSEATALRDLGFEGEILIVGPVAPNQLSEVCRLDAQLIVGNHPLLEAWMASADQAKIHVKFDTGMARQGFWPDAAESLVPLLNPFKAKVAGIATHFSNVEDVLNFDYACLQLERFAAARAVFAEEFPGLIAHAASSASSLILPESRLDLCRIGISLYGNWPSPLTRTSYLHQNRTLPELRPVLRWVTEIDSVKPVAKGTFIGYGCTFKAQTAMKVAVLPVGYFDGYPRLAGENLSYVIVQNTRCAIVGRICMNMMMVDVSHLTEVHAGEEAILIGASANEAISAADLAQKARTIDYELLSRLNPAIPKTLI